MAQEDYWTIPLLHFISLYRKNGSCLTTSGGNELKVIVSGGTRQMLAKAPSQCLADLSAEHHCML